MYSASWFSTFAQSVPPGRAESEALALTVHMPLQQFPRVLDLGCGSGRMLCPLVEAGYKVTGLDVSIPALQLARYACPTATLVALDQRHVGAFRWTFDVALILWNSLGFGSPEDDLTTLNGVRQVLRPEGRLLLDLYNPGWLQRNQLQNYSDPRGAVVSRQLHESRVVHSITYPDGSTDQIQFNVYSPSEIRRLLLSIGFEVAPPLVWWKQASIGTEDARYQIVATRRS